MEDLTLAHYYPMLPAVRQAISVDFGSGNRSDWPHAVHLRHVNRSRNNGATSGRGLEETASYITAETDPDKANKWGTDDDGFDQSLEINEARDLWKRMGYGYVVTGSLKEQEFLMKKCEIKCVCFVDEGHLSSYLKSVHQADNLQYEMDELPSDYDLVNTCTNSHHRSWRLARLVEDYQKYFFETFSRRAVCSALKDMGKLKFPE